MGHMAEDYVLSFLENLVPDSKAERNLGDPFITDIFWRLPNVTYKVEVKYDLMVQKTHRVALEHKALTNSSSDLLVYVLEPNKSVHLFTMREARELLGKYPVTTGGDFGDELTLIPERDFYRLTTTLRNN